MKLGVSKSRNEISDHRYISYRESLGALRKVSNKNHTTSIFAVRLLLNPIRLFVALRVRLRASRIEAARNKHNRLFVIDELVRQKEFLDDVESYPLDEQQRAAVVADEDNCLVVAGAGSGKTSTIVAKIKYLIAVRGIPAEDILPISFTNKSAADLKLRIGLKLVEPMTFHKFGLSVLEEVEGKRPHIYDSSKNVTVFKQYIEKLTKESDYLTLLNSFFLNYIKIPKSQFDFDSHGAYIQYLREQDYTTFKRIKVQFQDKVTYKNEVVKSIEECIIANYLFFNQVEYSYEQPYKLNFRDYNNTRTYKPDFTIHTKTKDIFLEHLGLDHNGNVPSFFTGPQESRLDASKRYKRQLAWKRKVHARQKTELLESYSYEFSDGVLLKNLEANLLAAGVELKPLSLEESWQIIQDTSPDQIQGFITLCQTFLSLMKSNNLSVGEVRNLLGESKFNALNDKRTNIFLDVFEPIYDLYQQHLDDNNLIDFNDMITKATEYIHENAHKHHYKYIIIDEFQDLSVGRYKLLEALRKQDPSLKLFCVGDDWQSIYRFTGADMSLFRDFETFFGRTYRARIETTYRFNNPMMKISSDFILKNPNQTYKKLSALKGRPATNFTFVASNTFDGDDTKAVLETLRTFESYGMSPKSTIYIIGRYNFDFQRIKNTNNDFDINLHEKSINYKFFTDGHAGKLITLKFVTAHTSKGLEADYVIILNCNSGKYGFPSERADDPILDLLLSSADQHENGEERRLFYVAMTRAKKHVAFVFNASHKSKFIKELQDGHSKKEFRCPRCGAGDMVLRKAKASSFYGCSNFPYGCEYTASVN